MKIWDIVLVVMAMILASLSPGTYGQNPFGYHLGRGRPNQFNQPWVPPKDGEYDRRGLSLIG